MADNTSPLLRKRCSHCKKTREVAQFGIDRKTKDGLNLWCKPCKAKGWKREYARIKREKRFGVQLSLDLEIKVCAQCKTAKLTSEFGVDKSRKSGLMPYCRACVTIRMAEVYSRIPDVLLARAERWRKANRRRNAEYSSRRNARRISATVVPFTKQQLNAKWDYWGSKCWVCGAAAAATDHVKPLIKGGAHMLCNLRPICQPCNSRKGGRWPFDLEWIRRGTSVL